MQLEVYGQPVTPRPEQLGVRRPRLQQLALLALLLCMGLFSVHSVRADGACSQPRVHWRSDLPLHWQRALLAACDELVSAQGLDTDARVDVHARQHGRAIELQVNASDGRTATRSVDNADELLMTMQALVLLPPTQRSPASVPPPPTAAPVEHVDLQPSAAASQRYAAMRQALQVEISAALMGRIAFLPDYLSPALWLSVGMHLERFTLGIDVRWNPFQTLISRPHPMGLEIESLGAGFFVVHRVLDADATGLDLGVHAFLSADTRALEEDEAATESTRMDGRLGVLARWGIGSRTARWTIMLDAELSPARVKTHGDFPTFSLGLGAGGVWEVK